MIFSLLLSVAMLLVIYYDATRYIIPNWIVGWVLLLYPVFAFLTMQPIDALMGLAMAAALLGIGFALFAFNIMGAGDVKLMAALGLWVSWSKTGVDWLLYLAILGGFLSIILIVGRPIAPWAANKLKLSDIPTIFSDRAPIPYGLAIAGAFLIILYHGDINGLPPMSALFTVE